MVLAHNIHTSKRTTDVQILQDVTFDTMLLSDNTLNGLKESGFFKPSPIQLHGIPLGKCGFDLILEAKSGTGKTAVFTIIALEKLDLNDGLQVIILAPTREIAAQICDVLKQIGCKYEGLCVEVVMGGLPIQDDINKFKEKNVHVLVGSPGRLKHLIHDKHIDTNSVRLLILDEADKLMEKSFLPDIKFIHSYLPNQKQVILSSATYPADSKELINQFVYGAQHICPNSNCILLGVGQKITYVKFNNNIVKQTEYRFKELLKIITKKEFKQCLIFCNYQARVGELHKMLTKEKWPAEQLYGKQEQTDRLDAIKTLQEYKCRILISTDLAARGIDASNVDLVINFEPPFEWQTYLHRIGRAGRYGSYGMAVTILSEGMEAKKFLNLLESLNISINLTPLWNEDITNGTKLAEEPKYEPLSKITKGNRDIDLWKNISHNEKMQEVKESLESFEELFKSFKELEINSINSFSDLVTSFNNNYLPDLNKHCDYEYKHIDTPKLLAKDYFDRINVIKENVLNRTIKEENKPNFENKKNYSHNEQLLSTETSKPQHAENENMQSKSIYGTSVHNYNGNLNKSINNGKLSNKDIENKSKDLNVELSNSNEILKLGLPLAFTSMKNKQNSNKNNSTQKTVSRHSKDKTCSNSDDYKDYKTETILVSPDLEFNNININNTRKCIYNRKVRKISKDCKSKVSPYVNSEIYHEKRKCNSPTISYTNWYNQLKLKIKQIEMAIYIDELSK